MKCYKRLIYKQFVKSQVFVAHSFWVICRNVSRTLEKLCMETPYWCTVLVHQYGRRKSTKHLEFTFSIKALSFQSRTSIRVHKHILKYLKWVYCWKSRGEAFFNWTAFLFDVTHCENSEVQIAVFSKWNMLGEWKLAQRFTFCSSST